MTAHRTRILRSLTVFVGLICTAALVRADDRSSQPFAQRASWKLPVAAEVRQQVFAWLEASGADAPTRASAEALWQTATMEENAEYLLDLTCATLALADPRAKELVDYCSQPRQSVALPEVAWLGDAATPDVARNNLRLFYGRWLVQERLYDEAAEQLKELKTGEVVDPAALLFYQAVTHHRMLDRDKGLSAIARLLEHGDRIPRRYASLARLMQADLDGLKDDSLDHVARRMDDIRRRLDLGRAGPKVREVEDGVIASLDKLIEEMEKQQQAAAAAAAAAQGGKQNAPLQPLPDSMPMGGKGEGKVANKPVGDGSGWGDLPPKQRDEALQQIGQEFPAHYRDMIEQYFRKLATDESAEK